MALGDLGLRQLDPEAGVAIEGRRIYDEQRIERADDIAGLIEPILIDDRHLDRIAVEPDAVANPRFAQIVAQIRLVGLHVLAYCRVEVDLIQEMHAAAKIEAEAHRAQTDHPEDLRRTRRERQSDDVVRQRVTDGRARA